MVSFASQINSASFAPNTPQKKKDQFIANANSNLRDMLTGAAPARQPVAQPTTPPPQITSPSSTAAQGVSQSEFGAGFLSQGAGVNLAELKKNIELARQQSAGSLQNANASRASLQDFINQGNNPTLSANLQSIIDANKASRTADIERLFADDSQAQSDFRDSIANARAGAFDAGLFSSGAQSEIEANLQRGLIRDRATALQRANELSRAEELGQIDQARAGALQSAGLFGNLTSTDTQAAQNALALANQAAGSAASTDLGFRQLGSDVLQQGIGNQLQSILSNAQLQQQQFQLELTKFLEENFANQQILENVVGKGARNNAKELQERFFDFLESQNSGGSGGGGLVPGLPF